MADTQPPDREPPEDQKATLDYAAPPAPGLTATAILLRTAKITAYVAGGFVGVIFILMAVGYAIELTQMSGGRGVPYKVLQVFVFASYGIALIGLGLHGIFSTLPRGDSARSPGPSSPD